MRLGRALVEQYCSSFRAVPRRIVLDIGPPASKRRFYDRFGTALSRFPGIGVMSLKGGFRSFTNTGVDGWVAPIGSRVGWIPAGLDTPITGTRAILEARGAPPGPGSMSLLTRD